MTESGSESGSKVVFEENDQFNRDTIGGVVDGDNDFANASGPVDLSRNSFYTVIHLDRKKRRS